MLPSQMCIGPHDLGLSHHTKERKKERKVPLSILVMSWKVSTSVITAHWNGFTDAESVGFAGHHSGILSYEIAVGKFQF